MTTVVVNNNDQLRLALKSDATEIIVENDKLIAQLRTIKRIRRAGPFVVAGIVASIALIPVTGGTSAVAGVHFASAAGAAAATEAAGSGITIAALVIAIGGTLVISMLTDWEEVEIIGVFKLKRKAKKV